MMQPQPYRLRVQQVEQVCLFDLTWGQGQQLSAQLPYPTSLITAYQNWQRLYLSFYKSVQLPPLPVADEVAEKTAEKWSGKLSGNPEEMRGRKVGGGDLASATENWHNQLVEAEAKLLSGFHYWLQSTKPNDPEMGLYKIRKTLAQASQQLMATTQGALDLFLTCSPLELARLPWEEWEIGADFAMGKAVQIVRTPANIREETAHQRRGRARVLAILGDDTGLNFQADRQAVRSLSRVADVKFVGWQPGKTGEQVKDEICQALEDAEGWDILFFAGHSNESKMLGGEIFIAPKVSISIQEIAPRLAVARRNGLQFAIFNSCSGLHIAESLIDLGFSQVAVMREPIHNRVAQEFLIAFMNHLAKRHNVHQSMQAAYEVLKLDKNITYPSAYLIPSLFCHPGAKLFQIPHVGWKRWVKHWTPKRYEAVAVGVSCLLAVLPIAQKYSLEERVWVQSIYRDLTQQLPDAGSPPVALVLIDDASVRADPRLAKPSPIDRRYLADLITKLTQQGAPVVGIDYALDRTIEYEEQLNQVMEQAISQKQTWFVAGALDESVFALKQSGIAQPEWSLQAHVLMWTDRVTLPFASDDCRETCPFAYLLALIHTARQDVTTLPSPQLSSKTDLRRQLMDAVDQIPPNQPALTFLKQARLGWISTFTLNQLKMPTLEPIIDFSIPPDRIYEGISAWQVLKDDQLDLSRLAQQVVIVGAGDYDEGGVKGGIDLYPTPAAVQYWQTRLPAGNQAFFAQSGAVASDQQPIYQQDYAGAEAHAYMVHHLLNQHLIVPIPTLWMMGVAVVVGRGTVLLIRRQEQGFWTIQRQQKLMLTGVGATLAYGLISLQLYVSMGVIFPWMLPSVMFWVYVFPAFKRRKSRV